MKTWLLILSCVCASAQTNVVLPTNVPPTATKLKLTKEMERLNASEFFHSKVDEWKGVMRNYLWINQVGQDWERPRVTLGATRTERENGVTTLSLSLVLQAARAKDVARLAKTQALFMVIDGTRVTLHPSENVDEVLEVEDGIATEHLWYEVDADFLRMLARAKKAQVRVEGENLSFMRQLSTVNIARFKVFVETFIDQKGKPVFQPMPSPAPRHTGPWHSNRVVKTEMYVRGKVIDKLGDTFVVQSGWDDVREPRALTSRTGVPISISDDYEVTWYGSPVYLGLCLLTDYPSNKLFVAEGEKVSIAGYPNGTQAVEGRRYPVFSCSVDAVTNVASADEFASLRKKYRAGESRREEWPHARSGKCSGSASCKVCTNCSRCDWCRDGKACGTCRK